MNHLTRMRLLHCLSSFFFLLVCSCSERIVGSDDVEYRTDENGSKSLYEISNPSPYGFQEVNGDEFKPSFVVDYFTDEEKQLKPNIAKDFTAISNVNSNKVKRLERELKESEREKERDRA